MVLQVEFGCAYGRDHDVYIEQFEWRGRIRVAFFRRHPSGPELIGVAHTGVRAGQKLPRR